MGPALSQGNAATRDLWWRAAVVALVAAGVTMRVWALTGRLGVLDSDEAIVGLMARDLLDGRFRAFFWGQHYAGTPETAMAAAVFAVVGPGVTALKAVAVGLSALASLLVWRVGRRLLDERVAQAAALFTWIAPATFIWWSTKTRGLYWSALVVGLLLWLATLRLVESPRRRLSWAAVGALGGLGFWVSPTIGYFVLPAAAVVVARLGIRRLPWASLWVALPAAVLGALPWLWHNVEKGWAGLEQPPAPEVAYWDAVGRLLWRTLPIALDLRLPISERWVLPWFPALYLAAAGGFAVCLVARRRRPALALVAVLVFPFLYAVFPGAWHVGEARYALFALPAVAILGAWAIRRPLPLIAVAAVLTGLTGYGLRQLHSERPASVEEDVAVLRAAGVDHAWADYWLAYRLTFESDVEIVATPYRSARYRPYVLAVAADRSPAFAYAATDRRSAGLEAALDAAGVAHRRVRSPNLVTVVAAARVDPSTLPLEVLP